MISLEMVGAFITASVLLSLAPGPDNVFVLTQSAVRGKLAGILVALGLCTGLIVHTAAVAFGIAIIFQTSKIAFTVLKLLGAGYLIFLAWKMIRSADIHIESGIKTKIKKRKLYFRGIIMNISNPKVSIFFLAFLPQFTDPARGSVTVQIIALGALFILTTIIVFGGIALLAGSIGSLLTRSKKVQKIMNWTAAAVFVAFAAKLATAEL
jgi:threonine/homoserine/homoserine lactone efflux protein